MRRVLLAAGAVLALAAAPATAATITDAVGDFLPTYAGPLDADLDVISFNVVFDDVDDAFRLTAAMAGDIDPAKAGLYAIGVDTGTGPIAPFADVGAPNVRFNQVVAVQKSGTDAANTSDRIAAGALRAAPGRRRRPPASRPPTTASTSGRASPSSATTTSATSPPTTGSSPRRCPSRPAGP